MTDDIVFCARTGRPIVTPSSDATSNIVPFSRRRAAAPKVGNADSYVERVTIPCSGTLDDIDVAAREEIEALKRALEDDDI